MIKVNIKNKIISDFSCVKDKTKLRFVKEFKAKSYINDLTLNDFKIMMNLRLNMVEVKANFKGNFKNNLLCPLCEVEIDTTEHLFKCNVTRDMDNLDNNFQVDNFCTLDCDIIALIIKAKSSLNVRKNLGFVL